MALKPDRNYNDGVQIDCFTSATGERGTFAVFTSSSTGDPIMDDVGQIVAIPTGQDAGPTKPAGLLLEDIVNYDLTRQRLNENEVQVGGKVPILQRGTVWTNMINTGTTAAAGSPMYYDNYGKFTTDSTGNTGTTEVNQVGYFLSATGSDGYAQVLINL
jgi:hypothetical protein